MIYRVGDVVCIVRTGREARVSSVKRTGSNETLYALKYRDAHIAEWGRKVHAPGYVDCYVDGQGLRPIEDVVDEIGMDNGTLRGRRGRPNIGGDK